ncbi:MAG: AMP-binding protein [Acidimicrobiales bacterium]
MSRVYEGDWIVSSILTDRAEKFGDETAVFSHDGDLSWVDLVDRAARVGGFLGGLGVGPGDRVATMLPTSIDYMAVWYGIVWVNAIDVPINNEYKGVFLEHILRDSGSKILVIDARWVDRLDHIDLPTLEKVVVVGTAGANAPDGLGVYDLTDGLAHDPVPLVDRADTDLTYIMYTSGTTGPAKGVMHNNVSSCYYLVPFVEGLDLTDDDVCYSMFPLFHQMGRSACTQAAFWVGNPVVLRNGFSASGFWDDIATSGATWMGYFGAVIQFLWDNEPSAIETAHSLTRAFGSSAPRSLIEPWQERFGVKLYEVYGSTEIGLGSGLGTGPPKLGTMGPICRQVEVQIVDEFDNPVPTGTIGEAVWRPTEPYAIFQGYWNRPEATVESWRNLWFHSGDGAYLDEDGYFVFSDRMKDSIRRRGENISSFFVEDAVRAIEGVKEVGAYAVPSDVSETEEDVMVAIVLDDGATVDVEAMFHTLCETMPRHAVPRYARFLDELPRTPTQRIRKFKLRDMGTDGAHDREAMGIHPPKE